MLHNSGQGRHCKAPSALKLTVKVILFSYIASPILELSQPLAIISLTLCCRQPCLTKLSGTYCHIVVQLTGCFLPHIDIMPLKKKEFVELTYLLKYWYPPDEPPLYSLWMASSEVDQKFLGHFAKTAGNDNAFLSQFLYRVLGLSVLLAEKLLRTRRNRRADPSRDASARQLLHHILWLSREGLVMVEQYILPMVDNYVELKVLAYKLRASFHHIFVLFHNDPPVNNYNSKRTPRTTGSYSLFPDPLSPASRTPRTSSSPASRQRTPNAGYTIGGAPITPPGLPLLQGTTPKTPSATATFLLPHLNYVPHASASFAAADTLAESLLPGSHPIRLSVKVEYVAYLYDCLHEGEQSRRLAKKSIADVYNATEGMDDESFEDAAELVGMLGRMMRRGLKKGSQRDAKRPEQAQHVQNMNYGHQQATGVGQMPQGTWV